MKKFILRFVLFSILISVGFLSVFMLADGKADSYYLRFTSPRQHSMIIGTSKAAQALQPAVLDAIIFPENKDKFYNFSFNFKDSPFGYIYLKSIEKKLDPSTKDAIFIVTVDPWSISSNDEEIKDSLKLRELNACLGKTPFINNLKPNIFYLLNAYQYPNYKIIRNWKFEKEQFLHEDGWLEVRVPMDSVSQRKRLVQKIDDFENGMQNVYKFSQYRLDNLSKTIQFLQKYGTVYLVRLPIDEGIFQVEDKFMPDFDKNIKQLSKNYNVPYLNYRNLPHEFEYTDGNHLYKTSGAFVSAEVANWILEQQASKKE